MELLFLLSWYKIPLIKRGCHYQLKKRGHILSTISLILKKGLFFSIFAQKCIRHMSLFLWCQLFFSMACKIIEYKSCGELFSYTPGLGSCRVYWWGFHIKRSWNICLVRMLCTNSLAHDLFRFFWLLNILVLVKIS